MPVSSNYAKLVRAARRRPRGVVGTSAMRDAAGGEACALTSKRPLGRRSARDLGRGGGAAHVRRRRQRPRAAVRARSRSSTSAAGAPRSSRGRSIARGAAERSSFARSFDVGSVRLTERHVRSDPPTRDELDALRLRRRCERCAALAPAGSRQVVGIAGTMTTLAAVSLAMAPYDGARVTGMSCCAREVERVVRELAAMPLDERRRVRGLEPKRADVIVAGGIIALALLERSDAERVRISDRGVRWGLAEELARAPQSAELPRCVRAAAAHGMPEILRESGRAALAATSRHGEQTRLTQRGASALECACLFS